MKITLVIGDKNLSSWSMRPWLALKATGLKFKEVKVLLDWPDSDRKLRKWSPTGKVPLLILDGKKIWDSLAIIETLNEVAPGTLWPEDFHLRALARSCVAEMHSGFPNLRNQLSMDIQLKIRVKHLTDETIDEIQRVVNIWKVALRKSKGPFLFGEFGAADAYFAPVVFRFLSYGIDIESRQIQKYMKAIENHPFVREWVKEALKEKAFQPRWS